MAGGRAFKSNVRERREAERRMKQRESEPDKPAGAPGAGAADPSA
jgi:hypothetical protein